MQIELKWSKPIRLRDGSADNMIYTCDRIASFPEGPGVYIFARRHGDSVSPLYVGRAKNLAGRLHQQFNNAKLMKGIENAPAGQRLLLLARARLKRGQRVDRVLKVVESALIEYSLAGGHDLLNKQGTKTKVHELRFRGNRTSRKLCPLKMNVRRRRT